MIKMTFCRINDNFTPQFVVAKLEPMGEKITKTMVDGGQAYYQLLRDEDGMIFVSFGINANNGKWWSSNTGYINRIFGIDCMECSVKQSNSNYPDTWFAYAVMCNQFLVPDCLEFRDWVDSKGLFLKAGFEFPRGNDYFMSTKLDAMGKLIYPVANAPVENNIVNAVKETV